jgi:uncharacterized protein (TIGR03084 family)
MSDLATLRNDLLAEQVVLDAVVSGLAVEQWAAPTPSPGWTVADQIGHLAYFDEAAALAITDPEGFRDSVEALYEAAAAEGGSDNFTLGAFRSLPPARKIEAWRDNRTRLAGASATLADGARVVWYGPSMGAKSFLTARLMEVWAHGNDVVEAVGATRPATDRLRHIARLGYITRGWSYAVRGEKAPAGEVRLVLAGPSGQSWTWGPEDADDTVSGSAEDFCLVVTQRRNLDDTGLQAGELGRHWLLRAQAFAGPPSDVPAARNR